MRHSGRRLHFDLIERVRRTLYGRVRSWGRAERRGGDIGSGTVGEVEGSRVPGYDMELLAGSTVSWIMKPSSF